MGHAREKFRFCVAGELSLQARLDQGRNAPLLVGDVADDSDIGEVVAALDLANRETHRKDAEVLPLALDLTADADDLAQSGLVIAAHIAVMSLAIAGWHQSRD